MDPSAGIINVNEYDLANGVEPFIAAITALSARVQSDGHPGVTGYRWFVNKETATAGAVIIYEDANAWVEHHRMAYQWEEMATLQGAVSLRRLVFLGSPSDEIREFAANADLPLVRYETWAAGF